MKFLKVTIIVLLLGLAVQTSFAQSPYRDAKQTTTTEHLRQPVIASNSYNGFIDPSRIKMDHSIGMGYSSMGGQGYSQGYYMNTLSYKFNAPVLLRVRTGVMNNPLQSQGISQPGESALTNMFNSAELFGGADLIWQPKENVFLQISFDRIPGGVWGYPGTYGYNRFPYGSLHHPMTYDHSMDNSMGRNSWYWLVR